ncbi:peptidase S8/S53 domain-containing protein, partial [Amylostereum chailletii]
ARGGGTSFAAPIVAAVVGALNAERAGKGEGPVGFLNPLLYANAGAFRDVVGGRNPGCGTEGFPAVEGWDPVTGMGTPLYSKLRAAAGL